MGFFGALWTTKKAKTLVTTRILTLFVLLCTFFLVPGTGIELVTFALQVRCSTY